MKIDSWDRMLYIVNGYYPMDTKAVNGVTVVTLMRKFDSDAASEVDTALKGIMEKGGKKIVCDFSSVDYINSTGLRILLSNAKMMTRSGGKLAICSLKPQVRNVFEIAGFTQIFRIFGSCDEAVQNLA
ncbi:MAG TPA: STAS domain-containing protein [Methanoregulaceae archaeon]|nr:STAS domain-containing protein [Methanoregulaceae archaeon]